jgi:hypothetical protein
MANDDGKTSGRWKRWKRLPVDVLRQHRSENRLPWLMRAGRVAFLGSRPGWAKTIGDMPVLLAEANGAKMGQLGPGFLYGSDQIGTVAVMRIASVSVVGNSSQRCRSLNDRDVAALTRVSNMAALIRKTALLERFRRSRLDRFASCRWPQREP